MNQRKSLGTLRVQPKSKPRSPSMIGSIHIQEHHLRRIAEQFEDGDREVIANLAAWKNTDEAGQHYLTIELQPRFQKVATSSNFGDNERSILDFLDGG